MRGGVNKEVNEKVNEEVNAGAKKEEAAWQVIEAPPPPCRQKIAGEQVKALVKSLKSGKLKLEPGDGAGRSLREKLEAALKGEDEKSKGELE